MKTNKKVMIGALLLFMMMAANFHNALNDYGIRSNAFMNGVIASGSNGSGSGTDDPGNWKGSYPDCGTITKKCLIEVTVMQNGIPVTFKLLRDKTAPATKRLCKSGIGICMFDDQECCISRTLGICTDILY